MKFIRYDTNSSLYTNELQLRDEVLRKPLGMVFNEEFLDQDKDQLHFSLLDDEENMKACVLIKPLENGRVKLRQMAVSPQEQGKGLGRWLVKETEKELKRLGFERVELHARRYAEEFYLKLGFLPVGEEFEEVGIPHIKMEKKI